MSYDLKDRGSCRLHGRIRCIMDQCLAPRRTTVTILTKHVNCLLQLTIHILNNSVSIQTRGQLQSPFSSSQATGWLLSIATWMSNSWGGGFIALIIVFAINFWRIKRVRDHNPVGGKTRQTVCFVKNKILRTTLQVTKNEIENFVRWTLKASF